MVWTAIIFALVLAAILTLIFSLGFGRTGPWSSWWAFFLMVFVVVWAASLWLVPVGPVYWDVAWLPILILGILVALLLAAAAPPRRPPTARRIEENPAQVPPEMRPVPETQATGLDVFFWVLLVGFILAIVLGYAF